MTPLALGVAIAASAINPLFGVLVAITTCISTAATLVVFHQYKKNQDELSAREAPQTIRIPTKSIAKPTLTTKSPIDQVKQTAKQVTAISITTQQQSAVIKATTASMQQSSQCLTDSSRAVKHVAQSITQKNRETTHYIHEIQQLRTALASTNTALNTSQQTLSARERELNGIIAELRATQDTLQSNTTTHQTTASGLIERARRTQIELNQTIAPLIAQKEAEINLLRIEITRLHHCITTLNQQLNTYSPSPATIHTLNRTGLFAPNANPIEPVKPAEPSPNKNKPIN